MSTPLDAAIPHVQPQGLISTKACRPSCMRNALKTSADSVFLSFRLKKLGGLGWKAKLVVGWALDREVADGLEIVDKLNNHYIVTAMVLRDELFNRLIAMASINPDPRYASLLGRSSGVVRVCNAFANISQ